MNHVGLWVILFALGVFGTLGSVHAELDSLGGPSFSSDTELHRVLIENKKGGEIKGSKDLGKTWQVLGHVVSPIQGGTWLPTVTNGVLAFNYLRGPSSVFASAVNNLHIRFSDPVGYKLPTDRKAPLVIPHGISIAPRPYARPFLFQGLFSYLNDPIDPEVIEPSHTAVTDILGGTSLFGPEWSPKVASQVFVGKGTNMAPIPYDRAPIEGESLLIITQKDKNPIEYFEFENKLDGKVLMKRQGEPVTQIAKVKLAVQGIGRYNGSEFLRKMGVIRANHAGVFDIGTTDLNVDPGSKFVPDLNELRGGFQIVPSHHFQDASMENGRNHSAVYMCVGPIQDPPDLDRYDRGIDGTYPLFNSGFRAGTGVTYFKFKGDSNWYELSDALSKGKFVTKAGVVLNHLRGYIEDALIQVTGIRIVDDRKGN